MPINAIPLETLGLVDVAGAASLLGRSIRGVQKLIAEGRLPVVVVSGGNRATHLLRVADLKKFTPPPRGRPKKPS